MNNSDGHGALSLGSLDSSAPRISIRPLNHWVVNGLVLIALLMQMGCQRRQSERAEAQDSPVDLAGEAIDPLHAVTNKAVVLIFFGAECPISSRYAPEIRRLQTKFGARGIAFWLVDPNADESVAGIRQYLKDYELNCGVLRDPHHALVRRAKVTVTPEVGVFVAGGRLAYSGRIDNRQVAFGQARPEATQHDLEEVLETILAGKPVSAERRPGTGCSIQRL